MAMKLIYIMCTTTLRILYTVSVVSHITENYQTPYKINIANVRIRVHWRNGVSKGSKDSKKGLSFPSLDLHLRMKRCVVQNGETIIRIAS